mgnify:CR=1 FL=1
MKACIIGAGFIAAAHVAGYEKIPQVELCGIADIRAEAARALADKHHCRAYTSALEMLQKEKPDAVSVCVPTHLLPEYLRFLERSCTDGNSWPDQQVRKSG